MSSTDVNDFCRLCNENIRLKGTYTKRIYEPGRPNQKGSSVFQRLDRVGLTLKLDEKKSFTICAKCFRRIGKIEDSLSTLRKWKQAEETGSDQHTQEKEEREFIPLTTLPGSNQLKTKTPHALSPNNTQSTAAVTSNLTLGESVAEVMMHYPSRQTRLICPTSASGIVENISKANWSTAAKLMMKHDILLSKIKERMLILIDNDCKKLCHPNQEFMLWHCSPDDLKSFSLSKMRSDLQRLSPFLLSVLSTITHQSPLQTCAAASVALRGRNPCLSAFAYYVNSVLQRGGAKKAVYQTLSKFGISTNHWHAIKKKHQLANTPGEAFHLLNEKEFLLNDPQQTAAEDTAAVQRDSERRSEGPTMSMELSDLSGNQEEHAYACIEVELEDEISNSEEEDGDRGTAEGGNAFERLEHTGKDGVTDASTLDLDKTTIKRIVLSGMQVKDDPVPSMASFKDLAAQTRLKIEEEDKNPPKQEQPLKRKQNGHASTDAGDPETKRPRKPGDANQECAMEDMTDEVEGVDRGRVKDEVTDEREESWEKTS